jgi:carboxyl-terminal processing protease
MFPTASRSRTPRNIALGLAALVLLVVGLWFGGHPSWLPSPLRSVFVSQSANEKLENQVFGLLSKDYYRPLNRTTLVNDGLAGAVASLDDPYSHYYDPTSYQAFQDTVTDPRDNGGIGVGIDGLDHGLVISEVYPGTPAAKAGLVAGDVILRADGASLVGRSEGFAADRIRGAAGSYVQLVIRHGSVKRTVRVQRTNITVPVATSRLLHDHGVTIGYVYLSQFAQNAGAEVRRQVDTMRHDGAQALILDLRDDGGGLVQQAVATASIVLPRGDTVVSTDGRSIARQVYLATGNAIPTSVPLVVLANSDTASSAEIVTGALKVLGRATVVGTHTYGKGVFQEIQPLRNGGALDFTVGHYYLPNGENLGGAKGVTRGHGIIPNVYAGGSLAHQLQVAERVATAKVSS